MNKVNKKYRFFLLAFVLFVTFIFCGAKISATQEPSSQIIIEKADIDRNLQIKKENISFNIINSKIASHPIEIEEIEDANDSQQNNIAEEGSENYNKESPVITYNENTENTESSNKNNSNNVIYNSIDYNNTMSYNNIPNFEKTDMVAYITCESANLYKVPIVYGWDQWIVDSYEIAMSDYCYKVFGDTFSSLICGHNNKSLAFLHNIKPGDKIIIETTYGANFLYEVDYSKMVRISENAFFDLNTNEKVFEYYGSPDILGIFTCVNGYSTDYRWFVSAEKIAGTSYY